MRRPLRSPACALALGAALTSATAARAGESQRSSSLGWVRLPGAETCIGARDLARAVEQRLGRPVFVSPAQAEVLIEGRIEPAPLGQAPGASGFRAHLTLTDAGGVILGTRDLDAPDVACSALDEQLALVVALLIDPDAMAAKPAPPAPPRVVVERVFVPVPAAPPPPPAREPWRESLSVGPVFSLGLLPKAGFGLALRGEIVPPSLFPLEIGGAVWLDARAEPAGAVSPSARGAILSLAYGLLGACPLAWSSGGTRLRACAEMEIGAIRSVGYGFTAGSGVGQEQPVVQASLAGRVSRRLVGPLEIGLGLALAVPLHRIRFFYTDVRNAEQELFRTGPVAGLVDAGLGVAFP